MKTIIRGGTSSGGDVDLTTSVVRWLEQVLEVGPVTLMWSGSKMGNHVLRYWWCRSDNNGITVSLINSCGHFVAPLQYGVIICLI